MLRPLSILYVTLATALLIGAAAAAKAEEVKLKHGRLTLNAELDMAAGKALSQGVVMIIHGTLAHNAMDTLANLRSVLKERGFNTLAVNLSLAVDDRHGMYDCKIAHKHKHTDALDEIGVWLDWLKSKGAGPVMLFGHSRGGNQVTRFTVERGHQLINRLALLAPATDDPARAAAGFERQHKQPLAEVLGKAEAMAMAGKGADMMAKTGLLYCPDAVATADSFISYYAPDPRRDTPSLIGKVEVPVLIMAGSADTVVPDLPQKMKGKADGKRVLFKVVDGADHFFLDLFAEDVGDAMKSFHAAGS
ncbi:MAG: alpha/beta hydrolase [Rhodospirillaceae bacterium]